MTAITILVLVLGDGEDYEYRAWEMHWCGPRRDFAGQRLSEIAVTNPFRHRTAQLYDMVRASGEPLGYRGWVGQDMPGANSLS